MMLKEKMNVIRKDLKDTIRAEMEKLDLPVLYGELTESKNLDLPLYWYFPMPHVPNLIGANSEEHGFNYGFVAMVKHSGGVEEGKEKAEEMQAELYDHITRSNKDNSIQEKCHNILPGQYNPAYRRGDSQRIFWASFEVSFEVRRYKTTIC